LSNVVSTRTLMRTPERPRYFWIAFSPGQRAHGGVTWGGLAHALSSRSQTLLVIDLLSFAVWTPDPLWFLQTWREHYLDPKWKLEVGTKCTRATSQKSATS